MPPTPLTKEFPEFELLDKEGFETVEEVKEATDEELLAIDGIGPAKLERIRVIAPFTPSKDEEGPGETTGAPPPTTKVADNATTNARGRQGAASDPDNKPNTADDAHVFRDAPLTPTAPGGGGVHTAIEQETIKGKSNGIDPSTGQPLPEGMYVNERGTITASTAAHESQPEVLSPKQVEEERRNRLRNLAEGLNTLFG